MSMGEKLDKRIHNHILGFVRISYLVNSSKGIPEHTSRCVDT